MPNFGSDVNGFTDNKTTQEIFNSHNKNETNMIIIFIIEHDKFYYFFHTKHDVHKSIGENTMCSIL